MEVLGFEYPTPINIFNLRESTPTTLPKAILTRTSGIINQCMPCFEEHEKLLAQHTYWIHDQEVQERTDD